MTKEELEKEAYKEAEKIKEYQTEPNNEYEKGFNNGEVRGYKDGYRDGAESREKQIQEKDKKIAELEHQLIHRNCLDCSNHSSKLRMRTLELEKENAELKEKYVKNITDCDICDTYCNSQLTKAKELIRTLISCLIDWVQEGDKDYCHIAEAEQFLNSEVEK